MEPIRYGLGVLTHHWGEHMTGPVYSILLAMIADSGSICPNRPKYLRSAVWTQKPGASLSSESWRVQWLWAGIALGYLSPSGGGSSVHSGERSQPQREAEMRAWREFWYYVNSWVLLWWDLVLKLSVTRADTFPFLLRLVWVGCLSAAVKGVLMSPYMFSVELSSGLLQIRFGV